MMARMQEKGAVAQRISRLEGTERILLKKIDRLNADRDSLEDSSRTWEKELNRRASTKNMLEIKRQRLSQPASDDDENTAVLAIKLNSINNYAPIDLEAEKKRMLESFEPKRRE